jgi:AmmeMemoRadiSam system protein B
MPSLDENGNTPRSSLGPNVAGSWYPGDPATLEREIGALLAGRAGGGGRPDAGETRNAPKAVIVPHAGLVYSGAVAGEGLRPLGGREFSRVILVGPSHHAAFDGGAVPEAAEYRTPLGPIPLDTTAIDALRSTPGFRADDRPFRPEHCLEMEMPFLQRVLSDGWRLLPVLIGAGSTVEARRRVAESLRPLAGPDSVVVVSSDFTHYGPRFDYVPFREDVPARIRELDMGAIDRILERDPARFEKYVSRTGATICGRAAIDVMLRLLPTGAEGSLVAYDTSGNITGDWGHSVSYASVIFRDVA